MRACAEQMEVVVHERDGDVDSFMDYVELNELFHARLVGCAQSAVIEHAIERVVSLPFASPSAFLSAQAGLERSREILLVAEPAAALLDAIEQRQGARAESVAREHARLASQNLDVALHDREARERLPGAALIQIPA